MVTWRDIVIPVLVAVLVGIPGLVLFALNPLFDRAVRRARRRNGGKEQFEVDVLLAVANHPASFAKHVMRVVTDTERAAFGRAVIDIGLKENVGAWQEAAHAPFRELFDAADISRRNADFLARLHDDMIKTREAIAQNARPMLEMGGKLDNISTALEHVAARLGEVVRDLKPIPERIGRLEVQADGFDQRISDLADRPRGERGDPRGERGDPRRPSRRSGDAPDGEDIPRKGD